MKKKRITYGIIGAALLLILCGIIVLIISINRNSGKISRQEWMGLLCEYSGIENYKNDVPYFDDIAADDPYFDYIQSAVEWDVIEKNNKFYGEKKAKGDFVAITAMKTVGLPKIQMYLGVDDNLSDEDYLKMAFDLGIISEQKTDKALSYNEANEVIEKLNELLFDTFWAKDLEEAEYKEGVKELDEGTILSYNRKQNIINSTEDLQNGDIITFRNAGFVVVRKVVEKQNDGEYKLALPEIEEAFETLKQSGVSELSFSDIVNYYGEDNMIVAKADEGENYSTATVATGFGEASSKGFLIEATVENQKYKIYLTDHDSGIKYLLPVSPTAGNGFENFSAKLDVNKIMIGSQIDYDAINGVKYADVAVDIETNFGAGVASKDNVVERFLLFETPAPIGTGLVGVDIQIYIATTLSGEIYLTFDIPFQSDVYFEKGKGIRTVKGDISVENPQLQMSAEIKTQVCVAPILVVGEVVPIIDAELSGGVMSKVEVDIHDNQQVCNDVRVFYPVMDISIGQSDVLYHGKKSLIAMAGWEISWENIFEDRDFYLSRGLHYEILPDGTTQYVDACTYTGKKEKKDIDSPKDGTKKHKSNKFEVFYPTCDADMIWNPEFEYRCSDSGIFVHAEALWNAEPLDGQTYKYTCEHGYENEYRGAFYFEDEGHKFTCTRYYYTSENQMNSGRASCQLYDSVTKKYYYAYLNVIPNDRCRECGEWGYILYVDEPFDYDYNIMMTLYNSIIDDIKSSEDGFYLREIYYPDYVVIDEENGIYAGGVSGKYEYDKNNIVWTVADYYGDRPSLIFAEKTEDGYKPFVVFDYVTPTYDANYPYAHIVTSGCENPESELVLYKNSFSINGSFYRRWGYYELSEAEIATQEKYDLNSCIWNKVQ